MKHLFVNSNLVQDLLSVLSKCSHADHVSVPGICILYIFEFTEIFRIFFTWFLGYPAMFCPEITLMCA